MPTYNHVNYLRSAVEGVMMQAVDLPVTLIIRDDASSDGTRELAEILALKFPGRIELILNDTNLFQTNRGVAVEMLREILLKGGQFAPKTWLGRLKTKRTAFIALCEGDDVWTDPQKLRKQLDVFQRNKSVRLVHHDVDIVVEDGGSKAYADSLRLHLDNYDQNRAIDKKGQFRDGHNIMTCTAMFRLSAIDGRVLLGIPPGLAEDWILFALISGKRQPHLVKGKMATYRVHGASFWSSKTEVDRQRSHLATREYVNSILRQSPKQFFTSLRTREH